MKQLPRSQTLFVISISIAVFLALSSTTELFNDSDTVTKSGRQVQQYIVNLNPQKGSPIPPVQICDIHDLYRLKYQLTALGDTASANVVSDIIFVEKMKIVIDNGAK